MCETLQQASEQRVLTNEDVSSGSRTWNIMNSFPPPNLSDSLGGRELFITAETRSVRLELNDRGVAVSAISW